MSDLQEVIVEATIRAFNAGYSQGKTEGYQAGIERALEAARFVKFDHHDLEVIALSDLEEEVKLPANLYYSSHTGVASNKTAQESKLPANSYHSDRQVTRSMADLEGNP